MGLSNAIVVTGSYLGVISWQYKASFIIVYAKYVIWNIYNIFTSIRTILGTIEPHL